MDADHDQTAQQGWLPSTLAFGVGLVTRHPWLVLCLTLLSCVACGVYTCRKLTYLTHRNDLISNRKDYLKRWQQYVAEFGDDDDMVVVLRGKNRDELERALEDLALEIGKKPQVFERLFYKADLRHLNDRALLFLPAEQIRAIQDHIQGMSLLLEPPVLGTFDPWFGWRSLSVQQLLREGERRLAVWKQDEANPEAETFFCQLSSICTGASDYLDRHDRYRNPWRSVLPADQASQQEQLTKPQYFFSGDGQLAFLLTSPVKSGTADSFTAGQASIDALREILGCMRHRHPEIEFGLTGLPVLENDEMMASQNDSNVASWLALAGVALLYLVIYRGIRYPLMTVAALVVGTIWALGWLTLTVGHLNILSSAFAVMLIGMGDYGVLWVTRFGQERQTGCDVAEAMGNTARHVGPSICTAAITTAFSFFAAMLADLKAVSELGWIAGCGVLLCALSCFVVTPALLAIFDFRMRPSRSNDQILSLLDHREARRDWLPALMRRPGWVLAFSGVATLMLAGFACTVRYDHNLLNMQAPHMESVRWEKTLIENMTGSSWYAVSWTTTPEEAVALKAKFEQLPEVSSVVTVADLIPRDQERKLDMLRDLQHRLRKLPKRGELIEHGPANLEDINQTARRVLTVLTRLQKDQRNDALAELQQGIERLVTALAAGGDADLMRYQIKHYEELMTRDLADDLHRLRDASTPVPIRLDDLPSTLRERYVGKNGKWLVRIFSQECLWNFEPLARFVNAVRTVDPESTGKPFTTLEGLKAMQNGFVWAGFYALLTMLVVLLIDFGSLKHTLVALLPLGMGLIATLGVMAILGIPLNPANMIALPLILGVGADNGVHVLHDFRGRDRTKRYRLTHAMGFGIMVAALTTILGFGTLMIAEHRGMASLGLFLTVGVSCCMLTALVFLPALLSVLGKRHKTDVSLAPAQRDAA